MQRSSLTALLAILGIIGGALIFAAAVVGQVHALTVVGLALLGGGLILACQGNPREDATH